MEYKRKAIVEFIPLSIGLAIALIIIVSVTLPMVNKTLYFWTNATGTPAITYDKGFGGVTGVILTNLLPLVAVIAIAAVASVLLGIFHA